MSTSNSYEALVAEAAQIFKDMGESCRYPSISYNHDMRITTFLAKVELLPERAKVTAPQVGYRLDSEDRILALAETLGAMGAATTTQLAGSFSVQVLYPGKTETARKVALNTDLRSMVLKGMAYRYRGPQNSGLPPFVYTTNRKIAEENGAFLDRATDWGNRKPVIS